MKTEWRLFCKKRIVRGIVKKRAIMHILAVDESIKKALSKSRRVLGAFLFRRGSRAFSGRLSQEGIDALLKNLRKEASKNTAVAIYKTKKSGDMELIARVGQSSNWDADGNYAFKTRGALTSSGTVPSSGMWRFLRCATRLAALFHDIGKANAQFQKKLRGQESGAIGERIRHELLSCLMFEKWCDENGSASPRGMDSWISTLSKNPKELSSMRSKVGDAVIEKRWESLFQSTADASKGGALAEKSSTYAQEILGHLHDATVPAQVARHAIAWLILTHHKPITAGDFDKGRLGASSDGAEGDIYRLKPCLEQLNACLPYSPDNLKLVEHELPWNDAAWLESVKDNASTLLSIIKDPLVMEELSLPFSAAKSKEGGEETGEKAQIDATLVGIREAGKIKTKDPRAHLAFNLAALARPLLILSDYIASAQKTVSDIEETGGRAFANTTLRIESTSKIPGSVLADTLPVHLLKTRRMIDPFFAIADKKGSSFPSLDSSKFKSLMPKGASDKVNAPARFKWQDDAVMAAAAIPNVHDRPAFAVIVSETGAGKTIGGAKIMAALSGPRLRYTCGLGLRSLTLQTGASYRENLNFTDEHCATLIGDSLYVKVQSGLSRESSAVSTGEGFFSGSENLDDYDEIFFDVAASETGALRKALRVEEKIEEMVFSSKVRQLIETPVVVCTIDHLMQASILQRGADAQPLLRLMTSDIILDEIDNYSIEDIKALCRLCQVAGLYRRRVVLMSATVSSTAVAALYRAWLSGIDSSSFRSPEIAGQTPILFMTHNDVAPTWIDAESVEAGVGAVDEFFRSVAARSSSTAGNVLKMIDVAGMDHAGKFEAIFQQALTFSRDNHTKVQHDHEEKDVSIGVVRFNKVQQARQFARWLHELPEDRLEEEGLSLRVQCYHSRFPLLFLSNIENELNKLLKRSDDPIEEASRLAANPLVNKMLASSAKQRHLILVSSTSIQETGRDHDYDFAVVEPRSTRSLVQMSGRVLRHRKTKKASTATIGMLSQEFADP